MSARMCTQFRCAPLRIKKALGIFRELITTTTTTTTTRVTCWDPPSGSKNSNAHRLVNRPGDKVFDVADPVSSKTGGVTWSVAGDVASTLELSRAAAPPAESGFSTDVDRRLVGLQQQTKRTNQMSQFQQLASNLSISGWLLTRCQSTATFCQIF